MLLRFYDLLGELGASWCLLFEGKKKKMKNKNKTEQKTSIPFSKASSACSARLLIHPSIQWESCLLPQTLCVFDACPDFSVPVNYLLVKLLLQIVITCL